MLTLININLTVKPTIIRRIANDQLNITNNLYMLNSNNIY